jgi:hypothetical protein
MMGDIMVYSADVSNTVQRLSEDPIFLSRQHRYLLWGPEVRSIDIAVPPDAGCDHLLIHLATQGESVGEAAENIALHLQKNYGVEQVYPAFMTEEMTRTINRHGADLVDRLRERGCSINPTMTHGQAREAMIRYSTYGRGDFLSHGEDFGATIYHLMLGDLVNAVGNSSDQMHLTIFPGYDMRPQVLGWNLLHEDKIALAVIRP